MKITWRGFALRLAIYGTALAIVGVVFWFAGREGRQPMSWTETVRLLVRPVMAGPAVAADEATGLADDELVVGVVSGGEAKAYPIRYLAAREHANDHVGGRAICATW